MLLGIDIDYLYTGVLLALLFCLLLTGVAWIVNEVKQWRRRRKEHS